MAGWQLNGNVLIACNCDWGCPCNFNVAPSHGHCDGVYVFAVREGRYGDTSLDGLSFAWAAHSPGPVHEGNVKAVLLVDEGADEAQREALEELWRSGSAGLPFDIFNSVTSTWLDTIYTPFVVENRGIDSKVKIGPDGKLYATTLTGHIFRFGINSDGTLGNPQDITTVIDHNGGARFITESPEAFIARHRGKQPVEA